MIPGPVPPPDPPVVQVAPDRDEDAPLDPSAAPGTIAPPPPTSPAAVVGGEPADPGEFDDVVALYALGQLACTGVLIAPDLVLTAGHCRAGIEYALVGTHDLGSGGEPIEIVDAVAHPDLYVTYDVAVLTLARPAAVAPRPLALDCQVAGYLREGAEAVIVGFGATDSWGTEWSDLLQRAQTQITDPECVDLDAGCNAEVSPGGELMAGGDGVDSCVGDSGGPLYLRTPDGDLLIGITSRAAIPAPSPCGGGGIYVRVDAIAEWIEATTAVTLLRPDCSTFNHPPSPTADPIAVPGSALASTRIDPNDRDANQSHTYALTAPPRFGRAEIDAAGVLHYRAPDALVPGTDLVVVEVTDDGAPPRSGRVEIPIAIAAGGLPAGGGCGCGPVQGSGGRFGAWTIAAGLLLAGRRSGRCGW